MKFPKSLLIDVLDLPGKAILSEICDHTRWSVHYSIVFKHDGKFYRTSYSVGATESQDESPWEYEDEVECEEVREIEKLVKVWEPI